MLHGGGQTRHAWHRAILELVAGGYYVVAPDARGHGQSGWAQRAQDYDLDHRIADLRLIIEQLHGGLPAIVGAAMGGLTALAAIGESDAPIARALVLVDVVPRLNEVGASKIADFMDAYPKGFGSVREAADAVATYLPHRPRRSDLTGLSRNLRLGNDRRYYWHWDPAFRAFARSRNRSLEIERLELAAHRIAVPTLLIRGSRSEIVTDAGVKSLLESIPHAHCKTVADAHHMVAGDRNDAFNAAVIAFLRSLPR
jgi:pimeloyl-ACP methyl ester carboxylesterase